MTVKYKIRDGVAPAAQWEPVFAPSGCTTASDQSKWHTDWKKFEAQVMGDSLLEDWSHYRAQLSDLSVDLSRANKTIEDQRRVIELLSANLAELRRVIELLSADLAEPKQKSKEIRRPRTGWRHVGFWKKS